MNKLHKLITAAILIAIVVISVTPAAAKVTVVFLTAGNPSQWGVSENLYHLAGDPSQWGFAAQRKVNEYEGQH